MSQSVVSKVVAEGKAILSADAAEDERFRARESIVGEAIASIVAAPVRAGDRILGILYMDRRGLGDPFNEEDLELVLAAARALGPLLGKTTAEEDLRNENRNLYRSLSTAHKIIGQSQEIIRVLDFIRRAAPTPMTVLIQGETGTGKELVASAIHYASPRRGGPFVAINCAALPENLIESELFGHERGSFTGAVSRKKGRFELADGGTAFLDEVSELTLPCQAKLLRLLEERVFERVGGVESIRVDVRIVAATNRNLLDAVAEGAFREDLFYRLNVLSVSVPPLRDRIDDVPILAEHFLAECGGRGKRLTKTAQKRLMSYEWPGNVRQLRNVIESATVLGEGHEIAAEDLVLPPPRRASSGRGAQEAEPWRPMSLQELEKLHVARVLEFTGGNKKKAAEILGIERCTLYAKLRHFKL